MPMLLGFILGVALTITGAFAYDTTTGRAPNGLSPNTNAQAPMVNWNVVSDDWHGVQTNLQSLGEDLQRGIKRVTG